MINRTIISKINGWIQALFYIGAGINHFISISFYVVMIPPDIPYKNEVNMIVGGVEILLGIGLLTLKKYRKYISILIILFLLTLLPAHIYHLKLGGCLPNALCIPVWACWIRIILQFVLMYWAWSIRKVK